jgi:hypothetical protein
MFRLSYAWPKLESPMSRIAGCILSYTIVVYTTLFSRRRSAENTLFPVRYAVFLAAGRRPPR